MCFLMFYNLSGRGAGIKMANDIEKKGFKQLAV